MDNLSKLQKIEKETNRAMVALSNSAQETRRLSEAAAKSAEKLELEASKICENTRTIAVNAAQLADIAIAASKK